MKKVIYTICCLCFFSFLSNTLQAQNIPEVGIIGGANFATITNNEQDRRVGFVGGIYGNFLLGQSNFSFSPEILYSQKGIKGHTTIQGQRIEQKLKLDYIEIPALFKYNFVTDRTVNPNLYAGPYVAFNINAKGESNFKGTSASVDFSDEVQTTDFGFVVGGGLGFGPFSVGVRYGFGVLDIGKEGDTGENRVLSLVGSIGI